MRLHAVAERRPLDTARAAALLLLACGLLLTALLDQSNRRQQLAGWRAQAVAEAERVGNELRYRVLSQRASLVSAATLYSGSQEVTPEELRDAAEVIHRSRAGAMPPLLAWLRAGDDGRDQVIQVSAPDESLLQPGQTLTGPPAVLDTLRLARARAPTLQVGALFEWQGRSLLALAVSAPNAGVEGVLLEILDFDTLLQEVGQGLLQQGMHLRILHPDSLGLDHARQPGLTSAPEATHSQQIDMGAHAWTLEWSFDRDFDGRGQAPGSLLLWMAGLLASGSLAFAFHKAIDQRRQVEAEVQRQRGELHAAMQLLASQERMAALGQLVAGVAHELGTPIGNARLAAGTLEARSQATRKALAEGSLRQSTLIEHLEASSDAARLVEQNLDRAARLLGGFKQVAVDRASERRRPYELRSTVAEILETLVPQLRQGGHRLKIDIPESILMQGYPGPLGQVLGNLVMNSLIHGFGERHGGHIQLQARALDAERVELRYMDDGVGIPDLVRGRVFEPFFTTRLGEGGSGLGLHIVLNLVQDVLGGRIRCEPSERGACFVIELPRMAPPAPVNAPIA